MIAANPPVVVEVKVAVLPFTVAVLTEMEVEVTVVRLTDGVTVLIGVVVYFSVAVIEIVVDRVVVGTVATELAAILVVHPSRVEVEAMTGEVNVENRPRAKTESLGMEGIMMRRSGELSKDTRRDKGSAMCRRKRRRLRIFIQKIA